jgi:SagB-type dehydrogenase family enzyme
VPPNADVRIARGFHDLTVHTPYSVRTSGHTLDWDNKAFPFKVYTELAAVPLPRDIAPVSMDTLAALDPGATPAVSAMTLEQLTTVLYLSAGVTKKKTYPGGAEVLFRAAASTGALYQTEVYVVAGAVEGLEPGLYHFNPGDFALRRLRTGDVRAALGAAAAEPALAQRAATLVLTGLYWRNAWKYQARAWRHLYWDSGTMLANLTAVGQALGLGPRVLTGFVDDEVNRLLGLDADREAALELIVLGPDAAAPAGAALSEIRHEVMPLSTEEVDYPSLREMQRASTLASADEVHAWRQSVPPAPRRPRGPLTPLPPTRHAAGRSLSETIQHRGSSRRFSHAALALSDLATVLWWATRPIEADVPAGLIDVFLVVNAVEELEPGSWRYWPDAHALERIAAGDFRLQSAFLTLEQPLGGDAAVTLFMLAPLNALLAAYGNRGYRLANLEAGLIGGRAYLVAYASRFGASGLTFYDREVVRFFAPHAEDLDAVFVTALGRAARSPW